jgi:hypothetical protein
LGKKVACEKPYRLCGGGMHPIRADGSRSASAPGCGRWCGGGAPGEAERIMQQFARKRNDVCNRTSKVRSCFEWRLHAVSSCSPLESLHTRNAFFGDAATSHVVGSTQATSGCLRSTVTELAVLPLPQPIMTSTLPLCPLRGAGLSIHSACNSEEARETVTVSHHGIQHCRAPNTKPPF